MMKEAELFQQMREKLYTPVVGDILDAKGYTHQFFSAEHPPASGAYEDRREGDDRSDDRCVRGAGKAVRKAV